MTEAEINLAIAKIEYPNDSWRMTHGDGVLKDYTLVVRKRNEKDNCKD